MRPLFCYGLRFLAARVTPDGRLAVAMLADFGPDPKRRVYMGLMRVEEFAHEINLGRHWHDHYDSPYRTYPRQSDYEMRFQMKGQLDEFVEMDYEEYAEEAWRGRYDGSGRKTGQDPDRLPAPQALIEDKSDD